MDITPLFKACIKTIKTRNKAFGVQKDGKSKLLLKTRPKNVFMSTAREVTSQITRLRDFLFESREPYLSFFNVAGGDEMTESERDQIDTAAQKIINNCSHLLKEFRNESCKTTATPQTKEFMDGVIDLIEKYLKAVCKIHSELKALRVRHAIEVRNLSRLEMPSNKSFNYKPIKKFEGKNDNSDEKDSMEIVKDDLVDVKSKKDLMLSENEIALVSDEQLSLEELQLFESENKQLYNELNSFTEEVKQIESKVLHIAELQEIFTEKVLQQEQDIDRISNTVVGATENVRDANEQIKQAIQRNAGLRVWVLFFLLVMSFSLLFLDWYND